MNMFKKNGGFTLVELIVVIAILAILAAVAIPAYSGYISKAEEANDYTALDSIKTAAVFAAMEAEPSATVTSIEVKATTANNATTISYTVKYKVGDGAEQTLDAAKAKAAIEALAGTFAFKSDNDTATWTNTATKWTLTKTPTT